MAKIRDKKTTKGQNSSRPPAKKYFKKLTNNVSVHPPSLLHTNSSENRALAPITINNSSSTIDKNEFPGYIFMCSGKTKTQCYINRVFGLPAGRREVVEKIKPGTKLFLFDTDVKLLYGVYEASSNGGMNLEPIAFGGMFPAQVRFKIYKDALPLPLSSFRHAIKDNYQGPKFAPELNSQQVRALLSMFRPIGVPLSGPRYPTGPNGAHESHRIPATNNGWINSTPLQNNTYRHNLPQQIMRPQLGHQNGSNPYLQNRQPAVANLAPPLPGHQYQFTETRQPYFSSDFRPHVPEPYIRYTTLPEMHSSDQTVWSHNSQPYGSPHLQTTVPYGGPAYVHPHHTLSQGHEVVDRSMPVSSYYSFAGGLQSTR